MVRSIAAALLLAAASLPQTPAVAQSPAIPAPEPDRLAAAQGLIEILMPPAERDAMIENMMRPISENIRSAMLSAPPFDGNDEKSRKFAASFDDYMEGELEHSIAQVQKSMPVMFEAMARAYARRFTLDELTAITAFYRTPAGRSYARHSVAVASDPELLQAQRQLMTDAMASMQERVAALTEKLASEAGEPEN